MTIDPSSFVRRELRELPLYHLDQAAHRHKLDQNEVPWDLPARLKDQALTKLRERTWAHYPDFHGERLRQMLGARYGLSSRSVLLGNGSSELLGVALDGLVEPGGEVISLLPGFSMYEVFVRRAAGRIKFLEPRLDLALQMEELQAEVERDPRRPVLLCTPNNPTGSAASVDQVRRLLETLQAPLLLDNAYGEFCRHDYLPLLREYPQLLVLRTFSKAWSLAGIRLGYLLGDQRLVAQLLKIKLPYNISHATAVVGETVMENPEWGKRCVRVLRGRRSQWAEMLRRYGLVVFPSEANFLLVRHPEAGRIREGLAKRGILVRDLSAYPGLANCLRIAIGSGIALRDTERALAEITGGSGSASGTSEPLRSEP